MPETPRRNDAANALGIGADEESKILIGRTYCQHVLPLIRNATKSIDILMFHWGWYEKDLSCEMTQINHAIMQAHKRGVKVRAYCNFLKMMKILRSLNIDAKVYRGKGILHAKLVLVDDATAVMGSHNFSQNALCFNKEISVLLRNPAPVLKLKLYFDGLWRANI